MCVCFVEDWYQ